MRRRRFERAIRVRVAAGFIRPPADLPRGALRVMPGRKLLVDLAEGLVCLFVVVLQDVMRREVVQRFFRPALRRKLVHGAANDPEILVVIAELARGDGVEEERFTLPRRVLDVRAHEIACGARVLEIVLALAEPQLHELPIVGVSRGRTQRLEDGLRLRVPPRGEKALAASDFELVAVRAGSDRSDRQVRELVACHWRQIAEREFVHDARERFGRLLLIAGRLRCAAEPHQHIVGSGRLQSREPVVHGHRGSGIVQRFVGVRLAHRRGFREIADGLARRERLKRPARVGGASKPELREPLVVLGVKAERALSHQRLRENRERAREIVVDLELDRLRQVAKCGRACFGARCGVGRQPEQRRVGGKPWMQRRLERRLHHRLARLLCARRGIADDERRSERESEKQGSVHGCRSTTF